MSSDLDVAAPGIGLPEEQAEPERGLWGRALDNLRTGNLGILPIVIGLVLIVVFFSFKATNFFTADNFNNIIVQMAGTSMLAFGVVFVLLLGEIDLSIGYLSGIAAVAVAEFQLPGSGHQYPGLIAIAMAVGLCAALGGIQGSVVALVGVPSFVVTLAGLLIFQGVILQVLELVKRLAKQGLAVVLISHNLHDVFEVATRITVLRLGRDVGVYERATTTQQEVVHAITAGIPTKVAGIPETTPELAS